MELESRLKSIGAAAEGASAQLKDVVGADTAEQYKEYAKAVEQAKKELEALKKAEASGDTNAIN
jgi:hypothetical protein